MQGHELHHNILYFCNETQQRGREQFVPQHSLSFLLSGTIEFYTEAGTTRVVAPSIGLAKRNQLVKSLKMPGPNGEPCKSISIFLDQNILRNYSSENNISAGAAYQGPGLQQINDPFIRGYFESLVPYFENAGNLTEKLAELKTNEAIALLLRHNPGLKNLLFDFTEPHKIDLEAYMIRHYRYNASLGQFAKLTGRSLATFKRDFQKIFSTSPKKWLLQKRLHEAHFLIAQRKQKPTDTYIEVGFENLSHFSTSFKELFGYNPSAVTSMS